MSSNDSDRSPDTPPEPADSAKLNSDNHNVMREVRSLRRQVRHLYVMVITLFVLLIVIAEDNSDPDVVVWTVIAGVVITVMSGLLLRSRSSH